MLRLRFDKLVHQAVIYLCYPSKCHSVGRHPYPILADVCLIPTILPYPISGKEQTKTVLKFRIEAALG